MNLSKPDEPKPEIMKKSFTERLQENSKESAKRHKESEKAWEHYMKSDDYKERQSLIEAHLGQILMAICCILFFFQMLTSNYREEAKRQQR